MSETDGDMFWTDFTEALARYRVGIAQRYAVESALALYLDYIAKFPERYGRGDQAGFLPQTGRPVATWTRGTDGKYHREGHL